MSITRISPFSVYEKRAKREMIQKQNNKKERKSTMAKKTPKLDANGYRQFGMRDCLAYAAGDLGCNMSFALKGTMALFWTQVMGLSAWYSLLIIIL